MIRQVANLFSRKRRTSPRSRLYSFAAVTLAAALVQMLLVPDSARYYRGEIVVGHTCEGPSDESATRLGTDPTTEILERFQQLHPTGDAASQLTVEVCSEESPAAGVRHIAIRCSTSEESRTKEWLQRVADAYIQRHHCPADTSQLDAQRNDLSEQLEYWSRQQRTTTSELESFVETELERRRAEFDQASSPTMSGGLRRASDAPSPAGAELETPAVQSPNAKWQELQAQLADADVGLQRLLLTHTEEHPLVIEARRVVDSLRTELAATPPWVSVMPDSNPFVASPPPQPPSTSNPGVATATPAKFDEAQARRDILETAAARSLEASLSEMRQKHQRLETRLQELPGTESLISEKAWVEQPPQIIASGPQPARAGTLLAMFLPAVAVGIVFAALPHTVTRPDYLCSVTDVATSLRLAVRGCLTTGDGPPYSPMPSGRIPALVRRFVAASELAIGLTILLVFICTLIFPDYGELLLRDPVDALGSTFQRLGIHR